MCQFKRVWLQNTISYNGPQKLDVRQVARIIKAACLFKNMKQIYFCL